MQPVIEIKNVSKKFKYNNKDFYALKDVSFEVKKGEIFGLLGPNGAGKSTIINMVVGILEPDKGYVKVFGKSIENNRDILEYIGFVSGESRFNWTMKTEDVLKFFSMIYGIERKESEKRISKLIKFFGLEGVANKKLGYLSTGERMRLVLAKSLVNYPKLLLLDEPTLGLDPDIAIKVREEIKRINKKFGTTVILTSHYMNEVEQLADRIAFINNGSISDIGTIKKVKLKHFSDYDVYIKLKHVKDSSFLKSLGFLISKNVLHKKLKLSENISVILSILVKNGYEITDIETKKPSLEDYFVKVAKK